MKKWYKNFMAGLQEKKLYKFGRSVTDIYSGQNVARSAAAMSYNLIMTVFPMLICASAVLGSLRIPPDRLFEAGRDVIPRDALKVINDFLGYVGGNKSTPMLIFGITATLTTSAAAFRTILDIMGDMQGRSRFHGLLLITVSFVMSVVFIAAIYAAGVAVIAGDWLMQILARRFDIGYLLDAWRWIRFAALFFILFVIVYGIYFLSAPRETKRTHRLPGALLAAASLVVVSIIFSRMITASIKYTLVYGSLASVIILLVWMYMCSTVIVMGNAVNISLRAAVGGEAG